MFYGIHGRAISLDVPVNLIRNIFVDFTLKLLPHLPRASKLTDFILTDGVIVLVLIQYHPNATWYQDVDIHLELHLLA